MVSSALQFLLCLTGSASHCPSVQASSGLVLFAFTALSEVKIDEETLCFSCSPKDFTPMVCLRAAPGHPGGHPCFLLDPTGKPEFLFSEGVTAFLHRGGSVFGSVLHVNKQILQNTSGGHSSAWCCSKNVVVVLLLNFCGVLFSLCQILLYNLETNQCVTKVGNSIGDFSCVNLHSSPPNMLVAGNKDRR